MTDSTPTNPRGIPLSRLIGGQRAGQMVPPAGGPGDLVDDNLDYWAKTGDPVDEVHPADVLADLTDGGEVDGTDPEDALEPGAPGDVEHDPPNVDPGHHDYVEPADVPEPDDAGGKHVAS